MPLPLLTGHGELPEGVHQATLDEVSVGEAGRSSSIASAAGLRQKPEAMPSSPKRAWRMWPASRANPTATSPGRNPGYRHPVL
jgi:hypothetical protein